MDYMPDNHIDLTVTSPPYDDLRMYNGYTFDFEPIAQQLYRVTKKGGVVVWVVGDKTHKGSESGTSFKQALYFKEIGFNLHDTMIYIKDNPLPVGGEKRYYQSFEFMFVLSKGSPATFNPIIQPRRNKHGDTRTSRVKYFNKDEKGNHRIRYADIKENVKAINIFTYAVGGGNTSKDNVNHPAMFPEQLAIDQVQSWSNEGDLIYDPFSGSGTTWLAAIKNNRRFIGSEISKEYVELAQRRIASVIC